MTAARCNRHGFTLVEVLVATVILGIVLGALLALVSGTTRFTARSTSASDAVRDISDASGYLGDMFRSAVVVRNGGVSYTLDDGTTLTCEVGTCIAFDVPRFDAASGDRVTDGEATPTPIDILYVYAIVARTELEAAWTPNPPYAADGSPGAIVRFVATAPGSDDLDADMSLLLDNVVRAETLLDYDDAAGSLRIVVQTGRRDRLGLRFFPSDVPLTTTVFRRN